MEVGCNRGVASLIGQRYGWDLLCISDNLLNFWCPECQKFPWFGGEMVPEKTGIHVSNREVSFFMEVLIREVTISVL